MIKFYFGDGDAMYDQKGVKEYNFKTFLGAAGSQLLDNLSCFRTKSYSKESSSTECDMIYHIDCEGFRDERLTDQGKKKIQKFFDEYIFNELPVDVRNKYGFEKGKLRVELEPRAYGLTEIDITIEWHTNGSWKYYPVCTICHEVLVR